MKREASQEDQGDEDDAVTLKSRRVVAVERPPEPRLWSIDDHGEETRVAELDPNGLVQELNKRLYREREWGKKRELFPPPDAPEEGPRADPELLAVTHNIAYARMEMEALAFFGHTLARGERLAVDSVVNAPLPLESDELQRASGRMWARVQSLRLATAKLRKAAQTCRELGAQGQAFFADLRRLRPLWTMRLWKRPNSDALELLVRVDALAAPETLQWTPLRWCDAGVALQLPPLQHAHFCGASSTCAPESRVAKGAVAVHGLLHALRASLHSVTLFQALAQSAGRMVASQPAPFASGLRVEAALLAADLVLGPNSVSTMTVTLQALQQGAACSVSWMELHAMHLMASLHRRVLGAREPLGRDPEWVVNARASAMPWALEWHVHRAFCARVAQALGELCARTRGLWFVWGGSDVPRYGTTSELTVLSNVYVYYGSSSTVPVSVVSLVGAGFVHINGEHKTWTVVELCVALLNTVRSALAKAVCALLLRTGMPGAEVVNDYHVRAQPLGEVFVGPSLHVGYARGNQQTVQWVVPREALTASSIVREWIALAP